MPDSIQKPSKALFVAVSGDDVYVGGQLGDSIVYWKNGNLNIIGKGDITGMVVVGNDIHIIGITVVQSTYWKNGAIVQLYGQDNTMMPSAFYAIHSYHNDVYITGTTYNSTGNPAYWKNNQPMGVLPANMIPQDIAVDGNDVYVTTYTVTASYPLNIYNAFLWKNGNIDTIGLKERPLSIAIGN